MISDIDNSFDHYLCLYLAFFCYEMVLYTQTVLKLKILLPFKC